VIGMQVGGLIAFLDHHRTVFGGRAWPALHPVGAVADIPVMAPTSSCPFLFVASNFLRRTCSMPRSIALRLDRAQLGMAGDAIKSDVRRRPANCRGP